MFDFQLIRSSSSSAFLGASAKSSNWSAIFMLLCLSMEERLLVSFCRISKTKLYLSHLFFIKQIPPQKCPDTFSYFIFHKKNFYAHHFRFHKNERYTLRITRENYQVSEQVCPVHIIHIICLPSTSHVQKYSQVKTKERDNEWERCATFYHY